MCRYHRPVIQRIQIRNVNILHVGSDIIVKILNQLSPGFVIRVWNNKFLLGQVCPYKTFDKRRGHNVYKLDVCRSLDKEARQNEFECHDMIFIARNQNNYRHLQNFQSLSTGLSSYSLSEFQEDCFNCCCQILTKASFHMCQIENDHVNLPDTPEIRNEKYKNAVHTA